METLGKVMRVERQTRRAAMALPTKLVWLQNDVEAGYIRIGLVYMPVDAPLESLRVNKWQPGYVPFVNLGFLWVEPEYRGQGIARELMHEFTEIVDERELPASLQFAPTSDMDIGRLRRFYESRGFRNCGDGLFVRD